MAVSAKDDQDDQDLAPLVIGKDNGQLLVESALHSSDLYVHLSVG